jgi:hypothetical protein
VIVLLVIKTVPTTKFTAAAMKNSASKRARRTAVT